MTSTPIRVGYVGCGYMAQKVHMPNLMGLDEFSLDAIAELREDIRDSVSRRLGVERTYSSHRELAQDPDLDAVVVSGHYSWQGDIAAELLLAGKHVLVEKPLAISLEQADRILEAERASGKRLMVAYMKRYDPGYRLLKRLLHDPERRRELGEPVYIRYHSFDGCEWEAGLDTRQDESTLPMPEGPEHFPEWLAPEWRTQYSLYLQMFTHNVNMMRWLFDAGDDMQVVAVDLDEDVFTGIVTFKVAGHRASLETAFAINHETDENLQIYCKQGWLRASAVPLLLRNAPVRVHMGRSWSRDGLPAGGEVLEVDPGEWRWSYKEELRHFAHALRTGDPFDSSAADSRTDVRVFEDIFRKVQRP
jgi:predicted dehydrogenase